MSGHLHNDVELLFYAAAGAFVSGAVVAPLFGQPNPGGAVLAALGSILATAGGAALGGLFLAIFAMIGVVDGGITMSEFWIFPVFATVLVAQVVLSSKLGLLWAALMVGVHLVIRWHRRTAKHLHGTG